MGEDESAGRDAKGKGKGKDVGPDQAATPGHDATEGKGSGSLLPRVAQSAASLPSFLLSGPPGAAGLGGGNEKGESSRTSEALTRVGDSSVQLRSSAPGGGTMRMGQTQEHIAREEASFAAFLDSESAPTLTGPGELEGAWQSAVGATTVSPAANTTGPPARSVAEQQARDGAEVVALLSGDGDLEPVFDSAGELPSQGDLDGLRKALFGDEADQSSPAIPWDSVLNFIPEYLRGQTAAETRPGDALSMHMGTTDAGEAWQTWIGQWSRVLTSYQDEVWGDLSALVEEARAEVRQMEETKPGEKPPEPTALLRLRAILGHLRGGSSS